MATNEGIRSPLFMQPAACSPKLRIYESLFLLNQGVDQVVATLRRMMNCSPTRKGALQRAHNEIEELRAGVNADVIEDLVDRERSDEGRFWKRRRAYERKLEDPDDVYIHLNRREEERKKQGLPPRIGILPHSAVSEKEQRLEIRQEQKRKRSRKIRK